MTTLSGLTRLLADERAIAALLTDLRASHSARVQGMPTAALAPLAAILAAALHRPVVLITATTEAARTAAEAAPLWLTKDHIVCDFPALELLPYERGDPENMLITRRTAVLNTLLDLESATPLPLVICPVRALLQPLMERETFERVTRTWRPGQRLPLQATLAHWHAIGYREVPLVEQLGQYARRGGVLDVFPAGAGQPVRIDLFDDEIESLRAFDPATQRSTGAVRSLVIAPLLPFTTAAIDAGLATLSGVALDRLLPHTRQMWLEDIDHLRSGVPIDTLAYYAPLLTAEGRSTLLDYCPSRALLLIDEPDACWQQMDDMRTQATDIHTELSGRGEMPATMPDALFEAGPLRAVIQQSQRVEIMQRQFTPAGGAPLARLHDWSLGRPFALPTTYASRLRDFLHDTVEEVRHDHRVVVVSLQGQRLADLYAEQGAQITITDDLSAPPPPRTLAMVRAALAEGLTCPPLHLTIYSDAEVFGALKARPVARFRNEAPRRAVLEFVPGDYVVHIEHGIGRFVGVVTKPFGKALREYLELQFAGTDRLYVPTDQLDRVTRYIGMGESTPALSKLGTSEWTRAKTRVKAAVAEIANELMEMYSYRQKAVGKAFTTDGKWQRELESSFPYVETPDQMKAIIDVKRDMESKRPMDRLVCGDVGYGKTEVALRAAFKAVMDGKQVAVLVPTTILAQQHGKTFAQRMAAFPVSIGVASRFQSRAEMRTLLERLNTGAVDIAIGTHRLLQKDVQFKDLGLLIIDEEQRFGVRHKERLRQMRREVDVLTMTATPIPRSLHMSLIGVRDLSVIETAPEGRLPIKTYLQPFDEYHIREAILRELDRGGQIYFVHNRVQNIQAVAERLRRLVPQARVTIAHGQMPEDDLERIMTEFAAGESDVLVCSTIIESGLDIPNVNTMIVNDAPIFGLAQLYQMRGRIGRSSTRAYAYLLYRPEQRLTRIAERRLQAIFETTELGAGMTIAMKDLEIRGAGNILGAEQSGQMESVGFNLYCRLLADEVAKHKGQATPDAPAAVVDLPLDTLLPMSYVSHEGQRLALYRRLTEARDVVDLSDLADELRDRFGDPPEEVTNLLASLRIKLKAERAGVLSVSLGPDLLAIKGGPTVVYDQLALYQRFRRQAQVSGATLRVPRSALPVAWMDTIEGILDESVALAQAAHHAVGAGTTTP